MPDGTHVSSSGHEGGVDGRDDIAQQEVVPLAPAFSLPLHVLAEPDVSPGTTQQRNNGTTERNNDKTESRTRVNDGGR